MTNHKSECPFCGSNSSQQTETTQQFSCGTALYLNRRVSKFNRSEACQQANTPARIIQKTFSLRKRPLRDSVVRY